MALVNCRHCGKKISSLADSCPKCGGVQGTAGKAEERPAAGKPAEDAGAPLAGVTEPRPAPKPAQAERPVEKPEPSAVRPKVAAPPSPALFSADSEVQPESWYYVTSSGRQGPVRLELLRSMAASGAIPLRTPIWKSGLPDWVVLGEYRERVEEDFPQEPLLPVPADAFLLWALALAPLWGGVLQVLATEATVVWTGTRLAHYGQLWWITALANLLVCYLDYYRARAAGQEIGKGETWLCLAVPAYIYRREKLAGAGLTRLYAWVASLFGCLALFMYLNSIYLKIAPK